ncbi:MAG TPA: HD domain-containing protein [Longimicrobium sp.]|jgi:(p)ppGpp synthase/HD superfamily hydrolase
MADLEEAIRIAVEAHRGQKDRAGAPYILHPLRMMFRMQTDAERMAAVLHDVVEDTGWTLDDLRERGFADEVVEAVDHLTRREGESYDEFVERAARHPVARRVKIADLEDNMDVRRTGEVTQKDTERLTRYHRAWRRLTSDAAG